LPARRQTAWRGLNSRPSYVQAFFGSILCNFKVTHRSGKARRGTLETAHGTIQTPVFMPVGTVGTVKGVTPHELNRPRRPDHPRQYLPSLAAPGQEVIAAHGGLHGFMRWDGPILTDSGGFQVWSLTHLRKISEMGVKFASPIDGQRLMLSPEKSMEIQKTLNSDIVMIFDECTPYPADHDTARISMELSLRWAERSKVAHEGNPNALFAIVQGGMYEDLRERSLEKLTKSASTATRWAACRWASRRRTWSASSTTWAIACRRTNRAT
jgi:queuine tRNA-ribosyltransferase